MNITNFPIYEELSTVFLNDLINKEKESKDPKEVEHGQSDQV